MTPVLYYDDISPPARAVLMTVAALNYKLELKKVDLFKQEQKTEEFLKLSPLGLVPILQIGDVVISDSHAICCYLAETSCEKTAETLYPKVALARARVLQMLFLDCDIVHPRSGAIMRPVFHRQIDALSKEHIDSIVEMYGYLESYLQKSEWLAGPNMTLADISVMATVSSCSLLIPIKQKDQPGLHAWFEKCKLRPWYQASLPGLERTKDYLKTTAFAPMI